MNQYLLSDNKYKKHRQPSAGGRLISGTVKLVGVLLVSNLKYVLIFLKWHLFYARCPFTLDTWGETLTESVAEITWTQLEQHTNCQQNWEELKKLTQWLFPLYHCHHCNVLFFLTSCFVDNLKLQSHSSLIEQTATLAVSHYGRKKWGFLFWSCWSLTFLCFVFILTWYLPVIKVRPSFCCTVGCWSQTILSFKGFEEDRPP